MIKNIKVTNPQGETLVLELRSPEKSGFFIRDIDGLGPSKGNINIGESLYEDGGYFNSSRVSSRNIVFDLGFLETPLINTIEYIRNQTYRFFPMNKEIDFEIETDSRIALTTGYVEANEPDIFSNDSGTKISVICPEAHFKSKDIIETKLNGSNPLFTFPFSNESLTLSLIEFGNEFINTNPNLIYSGDIPTGVLFILNFTGDVIGLTITNANTSTSMVFDSTKLATLTGSNFMNGDILTVSTIRGSKYVSLLRSGVTWNILNTVSQNADWFQVEKGITVFSLTASSGINNVSYSIFHQPLYAGV